MFAFLRRLLQGTPLDPVGLFGYRLDYNRRRYIQELGPLGTHAWIATDFEDTMPNQVPGAPLSRLVNMGDLPDEPLRRTRTVKGPMVFHNDLGIPLFQGEKAPPPTSSPDVTMAADYLDKWAESIGETGYPS